MYAFGFLIYAVFKVCKSKSKFKQKLKKLLFWNGILRFFIESYLEYSIAALVNLKKSNYQMETLDDKINYYYSILSAGFLISYPIIIYVFLRQQQEKDLLYDK
jgi:hypothetical protein